MDYPGVFITIEGVEGVGKSTNIAFIRDFLESRGKTVLLTREPGGTEVAEAIRKILLTDWEEPVDSMTELLLVFAARAQHLARKILPALEQGLWVVCDRFTDATYAYQGGGRHMEWEKIALLESLVQGSLQPDATLLLDLPVEIGLERARQRSEADRFEKEAVPFFHRVREAYLKRAATSPRYHRVDASGSREMVQEAIKPVLEQLLARFE